MVNDVLPGNEWETAEEPARSRPSPDVIYRQLTVAGWDPREAGNLIAHLESLARHDSAGRSVKSTIYFSFEGCRRAAD